MSLTDALSSSLQVILNWQAPFFLVSAASAAIVILLFAMPISGFATYMERKISADFHERIGPNRVGPWGLLQLIVDGIKMFLKEDTISKNADKTIYNLAPSLVTLGSLGAFAVIPFSAYVIGADLNIGVFYAMALGSVVSLGVLLGAWSSDNKWSLLGGMRGAAQIVSYEIPLGIAVLSVVTVCGTMSMHELVSMQAWPIAGGRGHFWNIFHNPFLFVNFFVYFIAALAECNRTPFDLPEAESELVSGFNTEFSGMRFGLYALAEFADVILFACISSTIFLGGWQLPFVDLSTLNFGLSLGGTSLNPLLQTILMVTVFMLKASVIVFVVMWLRWTLPRLRVDQLMNMCWKYLIPISFVCLIGAALWVWFFEGIVGWPSSSLLHLFGRMIGVYT
jgi:NADH-quinone oxidoreductase subunit H